MPAERRARDRRGRSLRRCEEGGGAAPGRRRGQRPGPAARRARARGCRRRDPPLGAVAVPAHRHAHATCARRTIAPEATRRPTRATSFASRPITSFALDVVGQGVLAFVRTNRWHGSPWHYVVDGDDAVVTRDEHRDPRQSGRRTPTFLPQSAFPPPLALTESTTQGADVSWVPIPFSKSFQLGYERTDYGTGLLRLRPLPAGRDEPLAAARRRGLRSLRAADVVALVARAGQDIAPNDATVTTQTGQVDLRRERDDAHRRALGLEHDPRADVHRPSRRGAGLRRRAHPHHVGRPADRLGRRARSRSSSATGSLYNRSNATVPRAGFPRARALRHRERGARDVLPDAVLQGRAHRARRAGRGARRRLGGADAALRRPAELGVVLPCDLPRSRRPLGGAGPRDARHDADRGRRRLEREPRRYVVHLFGASQSRDAGGRPSLLLRRQPDPAGAGDRHRGVGRGRRLLERRA